ncbi:hypothetical protein [Massilia sp. Root335]|uniref:hypothetical protein n=1 Tax=Massilia sp. Root335 TaxID=1736517 RepID=UPI0006FA74A5|nr:hypothetical protein [Massilia sp. Root335]KQV37118.1 hypothetical protein ASC93_20875 [Massilia sp. Root335]
MQEHIASSVLSKEKNKARAKAILNRPTSAVPTVLVTMSIAGIGGFLQSVEKFEAPMWVSVLLIVSASVAAANMMESWTIRRRLDAAIVLLEQQQDADQ